MPPSGRRPARIIKRSQNTRLVVDSLVTHSTRFAAVRRGKRVFFELHLAALRVMERRRVGRVRPGDGEKSHLRVMRAGRDCEAALQSLCESGSSGTNTIVCRSRHGSRTGRTSMHARLFRGSNTDRDSPQRLCDGDCLGRTADEHEPTLTPGFTQANLVQRLIAVINHHLRAIGMSKKVPDTNGTAVWRVRSCGNSRRLRSEPGASPAGIGANPCMAYGSAIRSRHLFRSADQQPTAWRSNQSPRRVKNAA
jgi:hypothetical protein